jgi:NADH dehydrogenase [ubiquinone] 1 alpha subcomplex assembly factor 6
MIISKTARLATSVKHSTRITENCIRYVSTVSTAPTLPNSRIYCQNLVRKYDYPSYLQIPFLPQSARDAHLAIRALNIEMALIPDTVSNEYARVMRMQFWKDAVDNCFQGRPKAEPVSILLSQVLSNGTRLTKSFFQSMISERVLSY